MMLGLCLGVGGLVSGGGGYGDRRFRGLYQAFDDD